MTDHQSAPQSLTDILWHLLNEREHQPVQRVMLLENYACELQGTVNGMGVKQP
jgi:hypothetical protein